MSEIIVGEIPYIYIYIYIELLLIAITNSYHWRNPHVDCERDGRRARGVAGAPPVGQVYYKNSYY